MTFMCNSLSWEMEATALVTVVLSNGQGSAPDGSFFVEIVVYHHLSVRQFKH